MLASAPSGLSKTLFQREGLPKQQGELEGAKPASNEIECLQKACVSRRLRRVGPQRGQESEAFFRLSNKVHRTLFDSLEGADACIGPFVTLSKFRTKIW